MVYRLGLPVWALPDWNKLYFNAGEDRLTQYASVFDCVEGNTTFYSMPSPRSVMQWREQLVGRDFEFCFKPPKEITHEHGSLGLLAKFLKALEPVEDKLGPLLVQLPASVGTIHIDWIKKLITQIPKSIGCVLEVRNPEFFRHPGTFSELFADTGCYRVVMDARPIHRADPSHPEILAAQHEKPDLPVFPLTCNNGIFVRLVLHPDDELNEPYYRAWAKQVAALLEDDQKVYMTIHCPNKLHCPKQAERFHKLLQQQVDLPDLPPWPIQQGSLF